MNWHTIDASIDEDSRRSSMTHPNQHTPLRADGSVPPSLQVEIPALTGCGEPPSPEFLSLAHALLDVRVPDRLGDLSRRDDFFSHPFFVKYGYESSEALHAAVPPFIPNLGLVRSELARKYGTDIGRPAPSDDEPAYVTMTPALQETLSTYVYPTPQQLALKRKRTYAMSGKSTSL